MAASRIIREQMRGRALNEKDNSGFREWFGRSRAVAGDGSPLRLYHGTTREFDRFNPALSEGRGLHFGSLEQARMRGGRAARILEVFIVAENPCRMVDKGSFGTEAVRRARQRGHDSIVYLNRYEGMTTERVKALAASGDLHRLDGLNDRQFRKLVPEAQDTWIVFEPWQAKLTGCATFSRADETLSNSGAPAPRRPEEAQEENRDEPRMRP